MVYLTVALAIPDDPVPFSTPKSVRLSLFSVGSSYRI